MSDHHHLNLRGAKTVTTVYAFLLPDAPVPQFPAGIVDGDVQAGALVGDFLAAVYAVGHAGMVGRPNKNRLYPRF